MNDFKTFQETIKKIACSRFLAENKIDPIAFIDAAGTLHVVPLPYFESWEEKEAIAHTLKVACKKFGAEKFAFVSEAWQSEDDPHNRKYKQPADDPNRKEVIMLSFEAKEEGEGYQKDVTLVGIDSSNPDNRKIYNIDTSTLNKKSLGGIFIDILK